METIATTFIKSIQIIIKALLAILFMIFLNSSFLSNYLGLDTTCTFISSIGRIIIFLSILLIFIKK